MKHFLDTIFGKINMTWPKVIIMSLALGAWTALMALVVPDGNSFHDIAVTMEWWVLPALIIIVNCKTPLDAALKTFVFFLISQPLIYLIQVPFSDQGFGLFRYYSRWFIITLATFPGAFLGWYVKKDQWYSGIILSVMTALLVITGVDCIKNFPETFPNHLITTIYCFLGAALFIFAIFKNWTPRLVSIGITLASVVVYLIITNPFAPGFYRVYDSTILNVNNVTLVGDARIISFFGTADCGPATDDEPCVSISSHTEDEYTFLLKGRKDGQYSFEVADESGKTYNFSYAFDDKQDELIIKLTSSEEAE